MKAEITRCSKYLFNIHNMGLTDAEPVTLFSQSLFDIFLENTFNVCQLEIIYDV